MAPDSVLTLACCYQFNLNPKHRAQSGGGGGGNASQQGVNYYKNVEKSGLLLNLSASRGWNGNVNRG